MKSELEDLPEMVLHKKLPTEKLKSRSTQQKPQGEKNKKTKDALKTQLGVLLLAEQISLSEIAKGFLYAMYLDFVFS